MTTARLIKSALWLLLAAGLVYIWQSDYILFERPAKNVERAQRKLSERLRHKHGIAFHMTFDEAPLMEWGQLERVNAPYTESTPGRFGRARRLAGREESMVETSAQWKRLSSTYTLSIWLKLDDTGRDQEIWYTSFQSRRTGLKLVDGEMTLYIPGATQEQKISYPFMSYGQFVHIAGTVDGDTGEARLYEDGLLRTEGHIELKYHPPQNIEFGKMRWYVVAAPLQGLLDEATIWDRVLSPSEIRRWAHAKRPLLSTLEPRRYFRIKTAQSIQRNILLACKLFDRLNPFLHETHLFKPDWPELNIMLSSSDARHFTFTHETSLLSGCRIRLAGRQRRVHAQYGGQTVEAQLSLYGTDTLYSPTARPVYLLQTPEASPAFGHTRLRLYPPESFSYLHPARSQPVSMERGNLVRLFINGQFKGVYVFEDFSLYGLHPGENDWMANGPENQADWFSLFRTEPPEDVQSRFSLPPLAHKAYLQNMQRIFTHDLHHPWSLREWGWRIRKQQKTDLEKHVLHTDFTAFDVLGANPSPSYITTNLDLSAVNYPELRIRWKSSNPAILNTQGRVTRPAKGPPVAVTLTADVQYENRAATHQLHFRVMPVDKTMPAIMVYFDAPLNRLYRTDFSFFYYPPGSNDAAAYFQGTRNTGGGIKHRGNSSYLNSVKKPFSLRFDEPHYLLDASETRHLYLLNGYSDSSRMHNKLAYDIFRSFGTPDAPRYAPVISWAEVFINGSYFGLCETATRIHGAMLGYPDRPEDPTSSPLLYKMRADGSLFSAPIASGVEQILPNPSDLDRMDALQSLLAFTSQSDTETFIRDIHRHIDIGNLIDFILLLNFTGNEDGRTTNFYLARGAAEDDPFFFIPWDYDKIFRKHSSWLGNYLIDRMQREYPDFNQMLHHRWHELRQDQLSEAVLEQRINDIANHLTGYMQWEFKRWNYPAHATYAERIDRVRSFVFSNLDRMDVRMQYNPAEAKQ